MVSRPLDGVVPQFDRVEIVEVVDLERAYREHALECYRFALRIVRDPDLAHDVVHDVFETLVRSPENFRAERGSLLTWLMTLTHSKAVDLVRWRHRHVRLDVVWDSVRDLVDPARSTEDAVYLRLDHELLVSALATLSELEREVLVLAHFGGLSQSEIASRTGVPLGTVKSRTRGGLRRLRLSLDAV